MSEPVSNESREPSPELGRDLGRLTRAAVDVPPEVDASIRNAIRTHFARPRPRQWSWSTALRLVPWAGAAAAIIAVMVVLTTPGQRVNSLLPRAAGPSDVDGNGRVDILDAFALARWIEAGRPLDATLDVNGDGAVDRGDADAIALSAVALDRGAS